MIAKSPETQPQLGASPGTHARYFGTVSTATVPTLFKSEVNNQESEMFSELFFRDRLDGTGGGNPLELGEIVARWNELKQPSSANRFNKQNVMKTQEPYRTRRGTFAALALAASLFALVVAPILQAQDLDPVLRGTWTPSLPPGIASGVAVQGELAYVAVGENGLAVIDVSDPANPKQVGGYDTSGFANGVAVVGQFAYVADGVSGLQVIDVSDPANPRLLGGTATGREQWGAYAVAIFGPFAYVAEMEAGLQVIDVSDPANPQRLGNYQTSGNAIDVAVSGQFAYVASSGLEVVDVSDPDNPRRVGWAAPISGETWGVDVVGQHAFVAGQGGLYVFDVSDPAAPRQLGQYPTRGCNAVAVAGNRAYLADWYGRLLVIDVNNPADPRRVGGCDMGLSGQSVAVSGNFAYVANFYAGLRVIDVSNRAIVERIGGYSTGDHASAVVLSDNYAYVASGQGDPHAGLHVINVSDPINPQPVASYNTNGILYGLAISDGFAFAGLGSVGPFLMAIDVSDPANPRQVSSYPITGDPHGVVVANDFVYVAGGSSGLHVINVSDPANPQRVGIYGTSTYCRGVAVSGQFAYVVGENHEVSSRGRLEVIDVSNPANPWRIGSYDTSIGWAESVAISERIAYVADGAGGLQVIDVFDPANPRRVGGYEIGGWAKSVAVSGNLTYVASKFGGLHVIDVRDPTNPRRVGGNSAFDANAVSVHGDKVFVAAGEDGLIILNKYTELRIGRVIVADDGRLRLALSGASDQRVRVQRSTNLRDWEDWQTVTFDRTTLELTDDLAGTVQRFYRAVEDDSNPQDPTPP